MHQVAVCAIAARSQCSATCPPGPRRDRTRGQDRGTETSAAHSLPPWVQSGILHHVVRHRLEGHAVAGALQETGRQNTRVHEPNCASRFVSGRSWWDRLPPLGGRRCPGLWRNERCRAPRHQDGQLVTSWPRARRGLLLADASHVGHNTEGYRRDGWLDEGVPGIIDRTPSSRFCLLLTSGWYPWLMAGNWRDLPSPGSHRG
mmetsp:Transcript_6565/g.18573  ORF Transcript_6565/g.18573 Transcript_6565/m.18573 type:complete len:202 (-) Transcript_6565:1249-1854(-)